MKSIAKKMIGWCSCGEKHLPGKRCCRCYSCYSPSEWDICVDPLDLPKLFMLCYFNS
uniref:Uncharacterized protein n=1 Tax=Anguilla anguilla TaxID=7936 RepID=A0A0E9QA52_ANGAN